MPESLPLLIVVVIAAICFGIANGFNDAANAIATVIGTRSLSPRLAIAMASIFNFAGAFTGAVFGAAVAKTIGKGIVDADFLTLTTVVSGAGAIVIWAFYATRKGLPISLSHGLVAGLFGAGIAVSGSGSIVWGILAKVISAVGIAPLLGFIGGFIIMVALMWIFYRATSNNTRGLFSNLQVVAGAFMAYSHGKNDGQMPIGLIAMALMIYNGTTELEIPMWVIVVSASAISFGTAMGGYRVIQTVGLRLTTLRPVHGFASTTAAATVIEVASHLGIPVSTTHCITSSVMGVGATRRITAVRWGIARDIMMTWILTFPACGILGWVIASLIEMLF